MGHYRLTLTVSYDKQKKVFKEKMSDLIAEKICVFYGSYVSRKVIPLKFLSFNLLSLVSSNCLFFQQRNIGNLKSLPFEFVSSSSTTTAIPMLEVMNTINQNTIINEKHAVQETFNFK